MGTIISNISKMKVISYSVALLVVVAVAVQAADVEFCHISVTNAATSIKGKIGTAMTGSISYPGCMTLANVDTSATTLSILDASDDSELATGPLTTLSAAANGANYVIVVNPAPGMTNLTLAQPRATTAIPAASIRMFISHEAKGVGSINLSLNNDPFPNNPVMYGDMFVGDGTVASFTGDVVAMNPATNATLFSETVPAAGVSAGDTALIAAVGEQGMTGANEPKWFINIPGASGTTTASSAIISSPAGLFVAIVAVIVSVASLL